MKEPTFRIFLEFTHKTMLKIENTTVLFDFENYRDANEEYERLCTIQPSLSYNTNEVHIHLYKLNPFIELKTTKYMGGKS